MLIGVAILSGYFALFYPNVKALNEELIAERSIDGVRIYDPNSYNRCEDVWLPIDVISFALKQPGVVSAKNIWGQNYVISMLSREKHCAEVATTRNALTRNGIDYQEQKGHFRILEPTAVRPEKIAQALLEINQSMAFNPLSLWKSGNGHTPINYVMYETGAVDEHTAANYGAQTLHINYPQGGIGFDVFAPTNFGLRVYYIGAEGVIASEGGDYNTAFYSVAVDKEVEFLLAAAPGQWKIYSYDKSTGKLSVLIDKYAVTSMRLSNDRLYFAGYQPDGDWDRASLFEYTFSTKIIRRLTAPIFADVRGMVFHDGRLYISDGAHDRLVVLDGRTYQVIYSWLGFTYPNGISLTERGTLLVADEHAGVVRELNLQTGQEIRSVGYRLFRSPGYAEELNAGPYKGAWLVADTDNDRLLLLDPFTKKIYAEVGGLRGPLDFAVLPTK